MTSLRRGIVAAAILACAILAPPTPASGRDAEGPWLLVQAATVSADEAAALVREATGGRILDVRLDGAARPPVYRVKVLLDGGRVRVYRVDANTGRMLP